MVLLRASKELVVVVEKPLSEVTPTDIPITPTEATKTPADTVPVVMYSGLAREVPYRYLGSKMVNSPEPNHVDGLQDPIETLAFPTVSEIVNSVEVPTAMPPTSPITQTSTIPVEAERIAARFRELGGVEVIDSEALAAMLKEKGIANISDYMSLVLKNCSPNILGTPSTTTPPTGPTPAIFTDPTTYVAPVWGDVGSLTTNLSAMRKDGPFSRYRTLYRLYCRCRTALSRCNAAQVVPVDGKPSKKLAGKGRKPGMRASNKTPEEIAAIKELREAKKRKVDKKDTTTEEERSLGFHDESKGPHVPLPQSDEDEGAPDPMVREVDRFADSLLPYVTESLFLSICAGIQCNTFGIAIADDSTIGFSCFPFASYFNHSCEPNLARYMVHTDPNDTSAATGDTTSTTTLLPGGFDRVSFYTLCDIKKGEELNICYVTPQQEGNSRRRQLLQNYRFYCQCSRCRAGKKEVNAQFCKDCDAAGYLIPKEGGTFCSICSTFRETPAAAVAESSTTLNKKS